MPILTTKNEYAVTITYKCNWNCPYCAIKNKYDYKENLSHQEVMEKLYKIPNDSNVTIFGGEPGLVEKWEIETYIEFLKNRNCNLFLETNGTFISNYPYLILFFKEVLYHCSENLESNEIIDCEKFGNIRYLLIIHDENINRLEDFLNHNKNIKFDFIEATYPYPEMEGPTLSKKNKNLLMTKFGNRMTKESFHRLLYGKDFDSISFLT